MNKEEQNKLIDAWIDYHTKELFLDENKVLKQKKKDDLFWAYKKLDEICRKDPDLSLEIILEFLNRELKDEIISNLAAGPLEDLLAWHGERIISKIEEISRKIPKFRHLLGGVWQNKMSGDIWKRVQESRGNPW